MIRDTTRLALQTAMAIFITEVLCYLFKIEKGYWATLTAMALTSLTWGENIKRSIERISMTILGGVTATLFYFILPPSPIYLFICLFIFLFLSLLFAVSSQLFSIFLMTGFVVFLFGLLSGWNTTLLRERIIDTIIGAAVSLFVSYFFFSLKPDKNELMKNYFEQLRNYLHSFQKNPSLMLTKTPEMVFELDLLLQKSIPISYTLFFHRKNNKQFKRLIELLRICNHQLIALMNIYSSWSNVLTPKENSELMLEIKQVEMNLKYLIDQLSGKRITPLSLPMEKPLPNLQDLRASQLILFHVHYILFRVNQTLKNFQDDLTHSVSQGKL
ncbi:TPA: hypothetical protein JA361_12885 [Legionella pneumophila]|nr:hypothetical protein [Legionella pneumophila]HAT8182661.1 hypothetical protein [Legionella pneumophila]